MTAEERRSRLQVFTGRWEGQETMFDSPWSRAGRMIGIHECRLVAGDMALTQTYSQTMDGKTVLHGHGVFSVDPASGMVLWHWWDNFGFPPLEPARGDWEGDTLVLTRRTPRGENRTSMTVKGEVWHHHIQIRPTGAEHFSDFLRAGYRKAAD